MGVFFSIMEAFFSFLSFTIGCFSAICIAGILSIVFLIITDAISFKEVEDFVKILKEKQENKYR